MRKFLAFLIVWAASTLSAQTTDLQTLATGHDARGWEGVGRLDIDGKGFCTGALIAPDLVLTAAHCMYDRMGGDAVDPARIAFLAGLRDGRAEATRRVRAAVVHPSYGNTGAATADQVRFDVALLQLDHPIRTGRVRPFEVSSALRRGSEISVVSYAKDRESAPSLQEVCNVIGEQQGVLIMDCDVDFGASGSPVFRDEAGVPRLVSVISAMADIDGEPMALGMNLAAPIATLRLALEQGRGFFATPPATARIIRQGERADTGARFVRP
ncbi:trypsin-like serine peptidase [Thalassorhabdomicrobium marinisediminis]|uniref:Trypsin n=1 Tax=Thalassorhabdomicrobium marinisediminis TaxID=2170577 RepID=A0A2T7FZH2_9RHOB|nr:trypsin-like serine protease [Thalassorhabdomicrobium marinisediminis]PVA07565.1 trypsin [Thalassorhabdomicrobium marinisediminis]